MTRHLASAIAERGLEVRIIVGAHTPWQASRDELTNSLALESKTRLAASP